MPCSESSQWNGCAGEKDGKSIVRLEYVQIGLYTACVLCMFIHIRSIDPFSVKHSLRVMHKVLSTHAMERTWEKGKL